MDKNEIIKKVYQDPAGFGGIQKTYKDAKEKDYKITLNDVKDWYNKNIDRKTQLKGYNSFINDKAYQEYEIDLAFIKVDKLTHIILIMIDIFSKYVVAVEIESKETPDVIAGVMEGINKFGHIPKIIYADQEKALDSKLFEEYAKDNNIRVILTRTHAWTIERFIRTLRDKINKRLEHNKNKDFKQLLFEVILTYNNKDVHSATGMTPNEAKLDKNRLQVKLNLEMNRIATRRYPEISVGDNVKIYKKKAKFDKEFKSVWLTDVYKVNKIEKHYGQNYYFVDGFKRPLLRHEILKVN